MKRLLTALVLSGTALAATACTAEAEPERNVEEAVEAVESAAEDAAEGETEPETGGATAESCDDELVTTAMDDIIATAGVELASDDSFESTLSCTWDAGSTTGPTITLSVADSVPGAAVTEELLESMGQEIIDDARFAEADAIPVVVLGCENGSAAELLGCAVAVYGDGLDITVQALMADGVTQDQLVDAAWTLTESLS